MEPSKSATATMEQEFLAEIAAQVKESEEANAIIREKEAAESLRNENAVASKMQMARAAREQSELLVAERLAMEETRRLEEATAWKKAHEMQKLRRQSTIAEFETVHTERTDEMRDSHHARFARLPLQPVLSLFSAYYYYPSPLTTTATTFYCTGFGELTEQ